MAAATDDFLSSLSELRKLMSAQRDAPIVTTTPVAPPPPPVFTRGGDAAAGARIIELEAKLDATSRALGESRQTAKDVPVLRARVSELEADAATARAARGERDATAAELARERAQLADVAKARDDALARAEREAASAAAQAEKCTTADAQVKGGRRERSARAVSLLQPRGLCALPCAPRRPGAC